MEEKVIKELEEPNAIRAMRLGFGDENVFWFRMTCITPTRSRHLG